MSKPFLTYEQQIKKLTEKGMEIPDKDYATQLLKNNSYFSMLSGYKQPFKKRDGTYKKGVSIKDIHALYKFDEDLRHIFLEYILIVERKIKSLLSYAFSERFGFSQNSYLNAGNFDYDVKDTGKIKAVNELVSVLTKITTPPFQYKYIKHQHEEHGNIPLWVTVKALTFGNISKMYSLSIPSIKTSVSKEFSNVSEGELERMLDVLSRFRNICAHDERLYDFRLNKKEIWDTDVHSQLNVKKQKGKYTQGKNDLFAVLIALTYLIDQAMIVELCNKIKFQIDALCGVSNFVPYEKLLKQMGFPKNWEEIAEI